MKYKTYNCNSYNIHTIKTDKFKTCHLEIVFRKKVKKEDLASYSLLADLLSESSLKYPTKKALNLHLEELYKAFYYCSTAKIGNLLTTNIMYDFISPVYINDDNYFDDVLSFPFETILHPNVVNDEFAEDQFELRKKRLIIDIRSIEESGIRYSLHNALQKMDKDSITALKTSGTVEEVELLTPASLYKTYQDLFKNNLCDIYLIGNIDMDKAVNVIKQCFKHQIINNQKTSLEVINKIRKKEKSYVEKGPFLQANLVMIFNIINLTEKEKNIVFQVYNYILGSGGLSSKLYQEIREKNSYCYAVESIPFKYDNILAIHVSLDNKNVNSGIKLIKKIMNNLSKDLITLEDLELAKTNLEVSLKMNYDSPAALINNYVFKIIDNAPSIEKKIELLKGLKLDEVKALAKKIKLNTIYVLEGTTNEED